MNITVLGAAGFIGTNLIMELSKCADNEIQAVDESLLYFDDCIKKANVHLIEKKFSVDAKYDELMGEQDIVYHLVSTNNPTASNVNIGKDIADNVLISVNILEACVRNNIKKVIFISSGGTVYGGNVDCPICEEAPTNPINTYGIQKLTIEKLLNLYYHMYGLEYSIVRISNAYGPHQRPNGKLGVVTTFVYKAIENEELTVYGNGNIIRDYIYIDDVVKGIINITNYNGTEKIFNLGTGIGTDINQVISIIQNFFNISLKIKYVEGRTVDVARNVLDITKYNSAFKDHKMSTLEEGIRYTIDYFESMR